LPRGATWSSAWAVITGNGGLLAAKEKGLMAIGVDQISTTRIGSPVCAGDQRQKQVPVAIYDYLKSVKDGTVKGGVLTSNLKNGGVGLAPYHDWTARCLDA